VETMAAEVPPPRVRPWDETLLEELRHLSGLTERILQEIERAGLMPRIPTKPDIYITYPPEGGWKSVPKGTTTVDLLAGRVVLPDGTRERTSGSLEATGFEFARSILVEATKTITVNLDGRGKFTISSGEFLPIVFQRFQIVYIETTEETKIRLWASTNPEGVPRKVTVPQITHLVVGTPVCELGRYSGTDTTYQTLVSWTVAAGKGGMLKEVAMTCKDATSFDKARFRLTIAGEVQFEDKQIDTGASFPFPPNRLLEGEQVLLEVKSSDGTSITASGSIAGKEV